MKASDYLLRDVQNSLLTRVVRWVILCVVILMGAWIVYFAASALAFPYPLEYREGASLVLTRFLLEGSNPFTLLNQPMGTTNYGVLYNLVALPATVLWGNTLLAHRAVTLLFIILSALLVFQAARTAPEMTLPALLAAQLVAAGLAARGGLAAFPTAMGAFLYLGALLIPHWRGFDLRGLAVSAILCLLAFYTKPYFVLPVGIVGSYVFLFRSKAGALAYLLFFAGLFAASFFVVRTAFPLYFFDTVISNRLQAVTIDPLHLQRQLVELGREFYPAILAMLLIGIAWLGTGVNQAREGKRARRQASLRDLRGPLLGLGVDYFGYAAVCSALAFVFILGPNPGSYLTSAYQIVLPPFMLWIVLHMKPWSRLTSLVLVLLAFNLVSYCAVWMNPSMLRTLGQSSSVWSRLYTVADDSGHILNSPLLAAEMVGRGAWPVDSGWTEYYFGLGDYRWSALAGPDQATINADGQAYLDGIRHAIEDRAYARLIVTEEPRPPLFKYGVVRQAYHLAETFTVPLPLVYERWDVEVWEPSPVAPQ